jgi:hypothetical protein
MKVRNESRAPRSGTDRSEVVCDPNLKVPVGDRGRHNTPQHRDVNASTIVLFGSTCI